jgi:hypothetical protein
MLRLSPEALTLPDCERSLCRLAVEERLLRRFLQCCRDADLDAATVHLGCDGLWLVFILCVNEDPTWAHSAQQREARLERTHRMPAFQLYFDRSGVFVLRWKQVPDAVDDGAN